MLHTLVKTECGLSEVGANKLCLGKIIYELRKWPLSRILIILTEILYPNLRSCGATKNLRIREN